MSSNVTGRGTTTADGSYGDPKPTVTETALLVALKKFFEVVLDFPTINR